MTFNQWCYILSVGAYTIFAIGVVAVMIKYRNDPNRR
jgi:hypothetical protein